MKLIKALFKLVLLAVFAYVAFLLFFPVPFDMGEWHPLPAPAAEGALAPNNLLASTERLPIGHHFPEDIVVDAQGRVYGGADDGKIIRLDAQGKNPEVFADTHGRPLGLIFDKDGTLLVCDSVKGLLRVSVDGSTVTPLASEADGVPFRCTNDLDVATDGTIYFTDSSFKYPIEAFMIDLLEHQPHGRFMSYDPQTKKVTVLAKGLFFANGVAVSPDQSFVLFVETASYKVSRYWRTGPKAGQVETFADNLPGIPDGILGNGKGQYWVTLVSPRNAGLDALMAHPFWRKVYLKLPASARGTPKEVAYVAELDADGKIVRTLQDWSPTAFIKITNAVEHDGQLYLGNIGADAIGRVKLPE